MAREEYRSNGTAQAERHAEEARAKADERRSKASGASGWVAERAGQWSLDGPDEGFVRMAMKAGVPIVPISTVGGPDSMPVLFRGRRLARALQLDKLARLKMFPIAVEAPWIVAPALLPELPLPVKIRTAFQPAIELDTDPERAGDD